MDNQTDIAEIDTGEIDIGEIDITGLIAKYDTPVPRYTSYPTAPHFSASVDAATYRDWLGALPDAPVSLYLHVPFCAQLCWFCGCHTTATRNTAALEAYSDLVIAEADLIAAAIGRKLPVAHMHWGGGSPTALPPDRMRAIMQHLRSRFDFLGDAEVAVEIDPRTADEASLDAVRDIGCNRASLGVQDFDEKVQAAVNRLQSYAVTQSCADALRARGIGAINLDLIYGLPYQTVAGVTETVSRALDIGPDRVAVFGYAHVPWMKKHQGLLPEHELPGALERWRQREAVDRVITGRGWQAIGLDHYARPEDALATAAAEQTMRRNFQGYTTDSAATLIGIGASSIGSLPQGYAQNAAPMPEYREAVRAGRLPVRRGIALSDEDKLRRDVIEQVMCQGRVDLEATAARYGADAAGLKAAGARLEALAGDGLVAWDGNVVAVRPQARGFVRTVAAAFDAYFQPQAGRHARAI